MKIALSEPEIQALIKEEKKVDVTFETIFSRMKDKNGHKEFDYSTPRNDGSAFYLILRQNRMFKESFQNPSDG